MKPGGAVLGAKARGFFRIVFGCVAVFRLAGFFAQRGLPFLGSFRLVLALGFERVAVSRRGGVEKPLFEGFDLPGFGGRFPACHVLSPFVSNRARPCGAESVPVPLTHS